MINAGPLRSSASTASARARLYFGLVSCVTALSCGKQTNGGAANGLIEAGELDSGSGGATISFVPGGSTSSGGSIGTGGILDAGPPPVVSCVAGRDASPDLLDGASCASPPSRCIDDRRLAYYTDGRCVDGHCGWTTQVLTCQTSCVVNGCRNNSTVQR